MLIYRILADVTVVIHALLALFVVLGLLAVLVGWAVGWQWVRNFWFRAIHLGLISTIVVFPLVGGLCPLTDFEKWLRARGGEETYPGSFLAYWVHELLFVEVSSRVIAVSYCAFGGGGHSGVFFWCLHGGLGRGNRSRMRVHEPRDAKTLSQSAQSGVWEVRNRQTSWNRREPCLSRQGEVARMARVEALLLHSSQGDWIQRGFNASPLSCSCCRCPNLVSR